MDKLIRTMIFAAVMSSDEILNIYNSEFDVNYKNDNSPLTAADMRSNEIIADVLSRAYPNVPILSEETGGNAQSYSDAGGMFIVDPLDGTEEFIKRNGEFCVSIGFSKNHTVTAGVIAVPCRETIYYAHKSAGAYKMDFNEFSDSFEYGCGRQIHVSDRQDKVIFACSRSHMDERTKAMLELNSRRILSIMPLGSCLKGCMIAEGLADIHYRFDPHTNEWDTAAMQIICEEAGAVFTDSRGNIISANRDGHKNLSGIRILNSPASAIVIPE